MNKKILIGSIIAVAILVLMSFTGVAGYQTTSNNLARASPLFNVRSTRAIDKDSKDIACDYIGKDKGNIIPIPIRDSRQVSFQKFLEIISSLDEERFDRLVELVISKKSLFTDELRDDTFPNPFTIDGSGIQNCLMRLITQLVISILGFISNLIFSILLKLFPTIYHCPTCMWDCPTLQI